MIELANVTKRFGAKEAVSNLSLSIRSGELFAFLGPNGAGKTTTIKMLTGLLQPTHGRVVVAGHDMGSDAADARRHLAYVPDQPYLYDKLTGADFLRFIRDIHGLAGAEVDARQRAMIDTFDLSDFLNDLIETYSHGMRQRVAFAAALLQQPKVLIVDEPMVGLDPKNMRVLKNLFRDVARAGTTVFMSTHTLAIAEEVADRIGIIHHGRLIHQGTLAEIKRLRSSVHSLEDVFLEVTAEAVG